MGIKYTTYATPRLDLGMALEEFRINPNENFIGDKVAPFVPVGVVAGTYSAITRESLLQATETGRNANGSYRRIGFEGEDKTYACKNYGIEVPLGDTEIAKYKSDFDAELLGLRIADRVVRTGHERRVAEIAFNATTFAAGNSNFIDYSAAPWATATVDIIGQIQAAKLVVFNNSGMEANTVIMSYANLNNCLKNDDIIGRIQSQIVVGQDAILNALANVFGVDKILVGKGVYDSGAGVTKIWSDTYVQVCVTGDASMGMPSLMNTPNWVAPYGNANFSVETYRQEETEANIIRVKNFVDEQLVDKLYGCMLDVAA